MNQRGITGKVQFPEKALSLFKPASYKVLYGGRSSGKTWSVCRALLILGARRKLFILCAREIQKSIKESVHKTLSDQIDALGLGWFYKVLETSIVGINGTRFTFAGIRNNITAIKSMEGIDICAVFEATFVSHHSWEILLPTVRKDPPGGPFGKGSEIIVEFNPELASDETYKRWVADPPEGAIVIEMNYSDNAWFPDFSRKQMEDLKKKDYESYLTVWEGKTRKTLEGAIYAKEIAAATMEKRISPHIRIDRSVPVSVSFDLGKSDMCAMWFWQQIGMEHHAVDFYGNTGFGFDHYLEEIQNRKYLIGKVYLPHDAKNDTIAAPKSIEQQAREAYPGEDRVVIVPRIPNITLGINLVRALFPRIYINEMTCADGLMGLQHYQYGVDPETSQRTVYPLHSWASNPADSLRTYVEGIRDPEKPLEKPEREHRPVAHGQRWMQ